MAKLVIALLFLLGLSAGALVLKDSPHLKYLHQDQEAIRREIAEMQQTSDAVTINGIAGNATLTQINSKGDMMFWWFVNKIGTTPQTDDSPLILWLQGGPGCSSMTGNLFEFGPWEISWTGSNFDIQNRAGTWATQYHLLFIDNPVGAGYSIPASSNDYVTTQYQMATNLYALLQNLTTIHPEFFNYGGKPRPFYIFGESYAGKYIPSIAYYILNWNQNTTATGFNLIDLQGIGIGDGITDPLPQVTSYSDYGMATALIDEHQRQNVEKFETMSAQYIQKQNWSEAWNAWNYALNEVVVDGGNVNIYNIREFGNYNSTAMDDWLDLTSTKQLLHVPTSVKFLDCGTPAYQALQEDMMKSVADLMPYILSKIPVMLYEGQDDLIINMVGAETWIGNLNWPYQQQYLQAPRKIWYNAEAEIAGYVRGAGNLLQVNMLKAGHMVPYDQLANSLAMVTNFITDASWDNPF